MSDNIKKLLINIKRQPVMYLGKKSLEYLATFLYGYMLCVFEYDGGTTECLPGFQEFIEKTYNISVRSWSEIIRFFCATEEEAFDKFFELLNEYYNISI